MEEDPLRDKPCTHAGAFEVCPWTKIIAGCDINKARLERFGNKWKVNKLYTDYKEMLAKEKPDIVCVAVWTYLHKEMTIAAAKSGVKGVFCEKPLALSSKDGRRMVEVCRKQGVTLAVNHERRYEQRYQKVREMIRAGRIGPIKTIIGNALSPGGIKAPLDKWGGGGYFHDGTHLIDLLHYYAGDLKWISGFEDRPHGKKHIEKTAGAVLAFRNGAMAFVEGGGDRKYFNFELDIQGTNGRIIIGNSANEYFITKPSPRFSGFAELKKKPPPFKNSKDPSKNLFVNAARDLVESIEKKREPVSSGEDGLKVLKAIEATYKSAQACGRRINIPPANPQKKRTTKINANGKN